MKGIKVNRSAAMAPNKSTPGKIPGLPKDFFETVLDCEVRLKEKFDMKALQKLIDYYSTAVGYYESINDPKYMIYNQSLSLLLTQPEVKKYLVSGNIKAKLKKEQLQKLILESEKKITTDKVQNFIKRKSTIDSKKTIKNLISKDMEDQSNDFKKRLAEKKRKYKLSTSTDVRRDDIGKAFQNINSIKVIHGSDIDNDSGGEKEFVFSGKNVPEVIDKNNNNDNNILDELKKEDLKNGAENKNENLENSFENKLELETKKNIPLSKNIKYTNKTMFLDKMRLHFDIYSNDYFDHFTKKISEQIIKDYNNYFNELTQALTDSAVNYINQEKEMEFLLTSDSDESYKKEINTIVQQLKEEEKVTHDKLIAENKEKIEKLNEKYTGTLNNIQSGHELEMLKERFKLDTTKSLNSLVFK